MINNPQANINSRLAPKGLPKLPPADSWDSRTGVMPVAEFLVECSWTPLNKDWALVQPMIRLDGELYALAKPVDIRRIRVERPNGEFAESPELIALAWAKQSLGSGGVSVLAMAEANPGHAGNGGGEYRFRWMATVGSRLSVALVKLTGNLDGMARIVPVE